MTRRTVELQVPEGHVDVGLRGHREILRKLREPRRTNPRWPARSRPGIGASGVIGGSRRCRPRSTDDAKLPHISASVSANDYRPLMRSQVSDLPHRDQVTTQGDRFERLRKIFDHVRGSEDGRTDAEGGPALG